jgi:transcriptional regulator with XRE-family HTH domain
MEVEAMSESSLGEKIQEVLQEAPFAMRQLAADSGLSYDVLRSWRSGRRRPSRTSAQRLAAGLQSRGELLLRLAAELRDTAEGGREASSARRQDGAAEGHGAGGAGSGHSRQEGGAGTAGDAPRDADQRHVAAEPGEGASPEEQSRGGWSGGAASGWSGGSAGSNSGDAGGQHGGHGADPSRGGS